MYVEREREREREREKVDRGGERRNQVGQRLSKVERFQSDNKEIDKYLGRERRGKER